MLWQSIHCSSVHVLGGGPRPLTPTPPPSQSGTEVPASAPKAQEGDFFLLWEGVKMLFHPMCL